MGQVTICSMFTTLLSSKTVKVVQLLEPFKDSSYLYNIERETIKIKKIVFCYPRYLINNKNQIY